MGIFYQAPQPCQAVPSIIPEVYPAAVSNPPFAHPGRPGPELNTIIASWSPPDPQPQRSIPSAVAPAKYPVIVSNPPFTMRNPLWQILTTWILPDPVPWQLIESSIPVKYPVIVDNPPFVFPLRSGKFGAIMVSWIPPDPAPQQLVESAIPVKYPVIVDNPPFGLTKGLWPVISSWQDVGNADLRSLLGQVKAIIILPDNPPFTMRNPLWQILTAWIPPNPQPYQLIESAIPVKYPVIVDNPPFAHPGRPGPEFSIIVASWNPPDPMPQRMWPTILSWKYPVVVNNPPFTMRNPLWEILRAWIPPDPSPYQLVESSIPTKYPVIVDNPPFANPGRPGPEFNTIIVTWNPPDPQPQRMWPTILSWKYPVVVNNPPFFSLSSRPIFNVLLDSWQVGNADLRSLLPQKSGMAALISIASAIISTFAETFKAIAEGLSFKATGQTLTFKAFSKILSFIAKKRN